MVKCLSAMLETWVRSLGQEDPLKWQPTPVLLPGKSHGRRSLVRYSPRGCKESDTTETSVSSLMSTSVIAIFSDSVVLSILSWHQHTGWCSYDSFPQMQSSIILEVSAITLLLSFPCHEKHTRIIVRSGATKEGDLNLLPFISVWYKFEY